MAVKSGEPLNEICQLEGVALVTVVPAAIAFFTNLVDLGFIPYYVSQGEIEIAVRCALGLLWPLPFNQSQALAGWIDRGKLREKFVGTRVLETRRGPAVAKTKLLGEDVELGGLTLYPATGIALTF